MDNLLLLTSNPVVTCAAVALTTVVAIHLMTTTDKNAAKRPPVVKYFVPWLGSAIVMGQDPDAFFRQAREKFGDIFGIQVAGQRHFHVTSASGIASVYKNAKSFLFMPTRLHYCHLIFDLSKEAVSSGWLESTIFPKHHRILAAVNVEPIVKALGTYGLKYINELHETFDPVAEHTTMENLIHQVSFRAISSALFGPLFPAKKAYEPFRTFDNSFFLIAAGVPKILLRKAIQARNEIMDMFSQYLEDPNWELEASELIRETVSSAKAADQHFSPRDCASLLITDFWASEGNMTWGLLWALNIPLHEKGGLAALYAEVDAACSNIDSAGLVDFLVNTPLPLVQSTIAETLRFTSSAFSIRTVVDDGAKVGEYEFRKGDVLICNTRAVHLDENVYGEDVTTFRGDRFIDGTAGKRAWIPFGGGISQCEGRHFALKGCKVLMALFLLEFDIRLDPDRPSTVDFDMSRVGGGVMHPQKPTHVVVTRRKRA